LNDVAGWDYSTIYYMMERMKAQREYERIEGEKAKEKGKK